MSFAIAVWSVAIAPGQSMPILPEADIRITGAALGDVLEDPKTRGSVKLVYKKPTGEEGSEDEDEDDEDKDEDMIDQIQSAVLCSLTPGVIEQSILNIVLSRDEEYVIEVTGKNTIYLSGNYIDQSSMDQPPFDDSDDEEDSDEDAFDLRDIMEEDGDESRFEELEDAAPSASVSSKKRAADDMDVTESLSTASTKKSKKQKAEDGKAVPVAAAADAPKEKSKKEKKKEAAAAAAPKQIDSGSSKQLDGGVIARDIKVGTGAQVKKGARVSMRYVGKLDNGSVFDKNTKGSPFSFHLGRGEVIKGWDTGIVGMQAGGERILTIPASMAYGKKKQSGIPANSTLTFEVKLLEFK